ncbi:prepilin peptidase [Pseudomonas viridiflava]|uniref:Prepilin type IV endopeptidase peptidase domain-containing protein n=1 Tax=Pseudomonas viridiflava TaxID=33069 RepID=A0A3M5NYL1_PSEVI|nr:A24 family peptidase [Pseudomonas viridiflava]RMT76843.1 hypothetical protein ALP40_03799 [Pseudomonas viridiflava]
MVLFFLLAWLGVCAEQDARQRKISNGLTLGGVLVAFGYIAYTGHTCVGAEPAEAGWALLTALALTLPGYVLGRLGAGDVKLLSALALATDTLYLLGTFIGAGIAVALWSVLNTKVWPLVNQRLTRRYFYLGTEMTNKYPFSPFLFIGFSLTALMIHRAQDAL